MEHCDQIFQKKEIGGSFSVIVDFDFKKNKKHFMVIMTNSNLGFQKNYELHGLKFNSIEIHACFCCSSFLEIFHPSCTYNSYPGYLWFLNVVTPASSSKNPFKWRYDLDYLIHFLFTRTDVLNFAHLMDTMEWMALQKPNAAPIIIFRELERLERIEGGELVVQDIISYLSEK